jgi:hypothetical protein
MGDGRTELFRNMWTKTTTNDSIHNPELYSQIKSKKNKTQYANTEHLFGKDIRHMPNQKLHRNVSFIKSGVRILGFGLCWWSLDIGVTVLILAEVIGVGEELV